MNQRGKEQQLLEQVKKIKDEGNLAINIMEEILKEIWQVAKEAVQVLEAPQYTEIKEMQLIIEWKIKNEIEQIKRKELITKLQQLREINIEQEMRQAMRRMENVRYKVQQVMDQMKKILSEGGQENPNCTLDNKLQVSEVLKGAQQVHLHMRKEMDEIKQEMQQLQKQAKKIKDKAQKLQQQIERELLHSQYINKQRKKIYEMHEGNHELEQYAQYAQLELLQITLIIQNQMQWIQKQAKIIENQTTKAWDWDEYCMKIACLAALRSKDPSTPVGACIADRKTYQIVGIGYNSMPYVEGRDNDKIFSWKGNSSQRSTLNHTLKYPYVVHAAVNAIINKTRESIEGCTIYLTHIPDDDCAHAIIKAGIKEVVYCMYTRYRERDKKDDIIRAEVLLRKKSIKLRRMENNDRVAGDLKKRMDEIKKARYGANWPTGPATDFITWETFFMKIALTSKERSTQSKYKVGACVVSPHKQVLSVGYNAYPEDMEHSTTGTGQEESPYMSHAEYKAIIGIPPSVRGCTLYVTKYPCCDCAKVIIQAGITLVVYDEEGGEKDERYISSRIMLTKSIAAKNIRDYDSTWKSDN